jgi:hypothetical protein
MNCKGYGRNSIPAYLEGLRKTTKRIRIAGVLTEIIIQDLQNMKQWYCVDPSVRVFFE